MWAKVSEILPNWGTRVLAFDGHYIHVCHHVGLGNRIWKICADGTVFYPTHWMPLPEPPP